MVFLLAFAFIAGIVTILSPCVLPVLPIILSSSTAGGKRRPLGVVLGFILSFTFFTLFLSTIVSVLGIPAESLRFLSIVILILFGLTLVVPQAQMMIEKAFTSLSSRAPKAGTQTGFFGGILIGLSLGLLWTPCVGPILASVISLALTGTVTLQAVLITISYSLGTAIPMFVIMQTGSAALKKVPWLLNHTGAIQKSFGVLMIVTAMAIALNVDRQFQTYILNTFPQYGAGLTKLEDNDLVRTQLQQVNNTSVNESSLGRPMSDLNLPVGPEAPELIQGGTWFNSDPLTLKSLRGKVVIVDFWTYSCINCQRTLPYLRSWYDKYKDDGLVIVGVHSPEFEFEKNPDNVAQALEDFGIKYPVMQDNDFATWRVYDNHYWPAKYIIDANGHVRYSHFGEGSYDETEHVIQQLLQEAGAADVSKIKIENQVGENQARSPETYLGYGRIERFASPENIAKDTASTYSFPQQLGQNEVAYSGTWNVMEERAKPSKGAKLEYRFDAAQVYLVMRPTSGSARVRVLVDGKPQYPGSDVKDGVVTISKDSLYRLVDLQQAGSHVLTLEFLDDACEVYAFTFG